MLSKQLSRFFIRSLIEVLRQTENHRQRVLQSIAQDIGGWFTRVHKMKSVYHALNFFNVDSSARSLVGECWCPVSEMDRIREALQRGTVRFATLRDDCFEAMQTCEYFVDRVYTLFIHSSRRSSFAAV